MYEYCRQARMTFGEVHSPPEVSGECRLILFPVTSTRMEQLSLDVLHETDRGPLSSSVSLTRYAAAHHLLNLFHLRVGTFDDSNARPNHISITVIAKTFHISIDISAVTALPCTPDNRLTNDVDSQPIGISPTSP